MNKQQKARCCETVEEVRQRTPGSAQLQPHLFLFPARLKRMATMVRWKQESAQQEIVCAACEG